EEQGSNQYQPNKSRESQGTSRVHRSRQASEEEYQNRQTTKKKGT
ncbi:unnamed protein product, partial [Schistosoma margrebowiei]